MPCYHPNPAWIGSNGNIKVGKKGDIAPPGQSSFRLPCNNCIGCRIDRSQMWATRCMHESSLHLENSFITLTYNETHLPQDGSLDKTHFQTFIRELRRQHATKTIRYYHCGEYGPGLKRPHYHALLFGHDFTDKTLFNSVEGINTYSSESLERIWGKGFCTTGEVTQESAGYVARYCMKKINGARAADHYQGLAPEYSTMSRRPGIASAWYQKYKSDIFPSDNVIITGGKSVKTPRYYDQQLEREDPDAHLALKQSRKSAQENAWQDQTRKRLATREICKTVQLQQLQRDKI